VIWLIQDFDLLSVILRALTLSLEALTVGGVLFLLFVATRRVADPAVRDAAARITSWSALGLAVVQPLVAAESTAMLMGTTELAFHEVASAPFFIADCVITGAALFLYLVLRFGRQKSELAVAPLIVAIVAGSVALSHAQARLDHHWLLLVLTAAHHFGMAGWAGAMPSLLVTMRRSGTAKGAHVLASRFSTMAIVSVTLLVVAGAVMTYFYVGSWGGMYGTSYGFMLLAKIYLLLLALALGATNFFLVRQTRGDSQPLLIRLRRFSEAEIAFGFMAILAGASLTSQPPAIDTTRDQLTKQEIAERMDWKWPSLKSPSFAELQPRADLKAFLEKESFTGGSENDAMDRAWSEYNHHWAGLIVFAAGIFALLARLKRMAWARNWPLLFIALAVFIVLRADPETWPLGPRPFWASFAEADVLEHRFFAVLITAFAIYEWAVQTGRVRSMKAALVFPTMCAVGGALLLTHSHAMGNVKDEMLAEMTHTPIALLGATAGMSRWVELRLPREDGKRNMASWIWPISLILVGIVLMDYRES
jgi:copper resistance protein D